MRARSTTPKSIGSNESREPTRIRVVTGLAVALALAALLAPGAAASRESDEQPDQVLEWNEIFIETLIATNTPNSSSQRLGATIHTAIFDAYNGIERRYTPILVQNVDAEGGRLPARGASRRAAVIAAAHTALVGLFPAREGPLSERYAASLAALGDDGEDGGRSRERGIAWGEHVAQAVLAWRATDGFGGSHLPFTGGAAVGQWRPIPPATSMSAQGLAFTAPFVLQSNTQFRPASPRTLASAAYAEDFNAVTALGRRTDSTRTEGQTGLAPFWEGNASVHWNQAANQIARANQLPMSKTNRLLAVLNIAMADTALTIWSAKRHYGADPAALTWRPLTAITLADTDGVASTVPDPDWLPLVTTPSHPEYPAGHPALNGAAATVLATHFADGQTFTLTTPALPSKTYAGIAQARADGNNARIWGGMHYPSTVAISDAVGEAIATYVNRNSMQSLRGRPATDNAVVHWSGVAANAIVFGRAPAASSVLGGMVHGAMYDAVAAVEGGLEPFATGVTAPPGASADAAVAQAARDVLVTRVPGQAAAVETAYAAYMASIPDGPAKDAGKAVGAAAAAGMLAMRTGDHFDDNVPYVQAPTGPGVFEPIAPTPPVDPKLAFVRPFTYDSPPDYRPRRPIELTSRRYARDVAEVQAFGRAVGSLRTPLQTETVRFHTEQTFFQFSRTLRELANDRGLDLRESARLLGYVHVATADTMIACWEAKYHFNFWRPNHAIQRADTDGNAATSPEAGWLPLIVGNHPEYPSGHACFTGAVTESLRNYFGTKRVRLVISSTAAGAGPPRTYETLDDLVKDVEDARVWGGLHYRTTMTQTAKHFPRIARDVGRQHFLTDAGRSDDDDDRDD